jgi:hypothetical protein
MNQENKRPITLEDLLRLKRAERPAAEFWTRFDRELRAKQLAALVKREPWWSQLPVSWGWLHRHRLPIGATAILALSFVAVREYRSDEVVAATVASTPTVPMVAASTGTLRIEPSALDLTEAVVLPAYDVREIPTPVAVAETPVVEATPARRPHQVSLLNGSVATELFAASVAAAQAAEPLLARGMWSSTQGFETRAMPERTAAVDPFQQMRDPTTERRTARVQSTMAMLSSGNLPVRIGSPITTRNYSEEKFYEEQRGRLEGRQEGLSVRF